MQNYKSWKEFSANTKKIPNIFPYVRQKPFILFDPDHLRPHESFDGEIYGVKKEYVKQNFEKYKYMVDIEY